MVLASASPARLATLRRARIEPEVIVSGVDEDGVGAETPAGLSVVLAELKAAAVAARLDPADRDTLVIGCDSVLEFGDAALGKPHCADIARARWRAMRGRTGVLHTGHHLVALGPGGRRSITRLGSTTVRFADVSDDEIEAYIATGEPLEVAGAFTIDGAGGAYVSSIDGDHHTVIGLSLPLLRTMVIDLGYAWHDLWVLAPPR